MITRQDLQEAIAECEGVRNPNANTCMKLAAFYIIQQHLFGDNDDQEAEPTYSFSAAPSIPYNDSVVEYSGETEFSQAIKGRNAWDMWDIMDELMSTLKVINPKLYDGVMRKIAE